MEIALHYYPHHIGDFLRDTASLSPKDAYIYLRLIWLYYESEKPLPDDPEVLAYKVGVRGEEALVSLLLRTYFRYDPDLKSHTHQRIDAEISKYQRKAASARQANQSRWGSDRDLKSDANSDEKSDARQIATNNQEPITNNQEPENQEPIVRGARGTRLKGDWALPAKWAQWARQERPNLNLRETEEQFRDYWIAQPGTKGSKTDWAATWRNWVRRTPQAKQAVKYDWLQGNSQIIEME